MTIDDKPEKEIEEIVGDLNCPKDFESYRYGWENLRKAKMAGTEAQVLICLEKQPKKCTFLNIAGGYICECPLRNYIAKKLKKSPTG